MGCFKCGATADKAILFDVISRNGVVKICNDCYKKENFPLVKQGSEFHSIKQEGNYGRFSGIQTRKGGSREFLEQDEEIKKVVDTNFKKSLVEIRPRDDLIDNFHWAIMRVRRTKHMTQKELAQAIAEPELAIKMAEEGVLGEDGDKLIRKIEDYFGIRLRKGFDIPKKPEKVENLDFNTGLKEELTISDLKEMEREKEELGKESFWSSWIKKKKSDDFEEVDSPDEASFEPYEESEERPLTDEELDDILFGKK